MTIPILDGHDCRKAAETLEKFRKGGAVVRRVAIDTRKTVLVPEELCEEDALAAYLRFNGSEAAASERVVASDSANGIRAIMAFEGDVYRLILRELGDRVRLTSPILEMSPSGKREVMIWLTPRNVYLAVWDRGLKMAEALPDPSVDSLLYYMQAVARDFDLRRFTIGIGGEGAAAAAGELGRYFKRVRVTDNGQAGI